MCADAAFANCGCAAQSRPRTTSIETRRLPRGPGKSIFLVMPSSTEFIVRIDGPIDYASSLEMFRRSGDDLIDRWDGRTFVRTIALGASPTAYACTFEPAGAALNVRVSVEHSRYRHEIERLVSSMFVMPPASFAE